MKTKNVRIVYYENHSSEKSSKSFFVQEKSFFGKWNYIYKQDADEAPYLLTAKSEQLLLDETASLIFGSNLGNSRLIVEPSIRIIDRYFNF